MKRYNGRIPPEAITAIAQKMKELESGEASIELHIRHGALTRFCLRVEGLRQPGGGFNCHTLVDVGAIHALEAAAIGIEHGIATLTLHINDGSLSGISAGSSESFIPASSEVKH
jgi:hypothetical protein